MRDYNDTLLPCPFCGGEASLDYDFNGIGVTYGILLPEYSEVIAWAEIPKPYEGEIE